MKRHRCRTDWLRNRAPDCAIIALKKEEVLASTTQNAWIEQVLGLRPNREAASHDTAAGKSTEVKRSRGLLDIPGMEMKGSNFILNGRTLSPIDILAFVLQLQADGGVKVKDPATDGRRAWRKAWKDTEDEVDALQQRLTAGNDPDLQMIGRTDILSRMKSHHAALASSLTALGAAKGDQKAIRSKKALAAVTECRDFVKRDKLFGMLERNPLGIAIDITSRLDGVLSELQKSLSKTA